MQPILINGRDVPRRMRLSVTERVALIATRYGRAPGLAVVMVGEDPASQVYVRNKAKATLEVGMRSIEHRLHSCSSEAELLRLFAELNGNPVVDGILVQLPLPGHINADRVLQAIDSEKDVDGFHPINAEWDWAGAVHPKRLHASARTSFTIFGWFACRCGGPIQYCRETHGTIVITGGLHRHHRSFAYSGIASSLPNRGRAHRRSGQAGNDSRQLD